MRQTDRRTKLTYKGGLEISTSLTRLLIRNVARGYARFASFDAIQQSVTNWLRGFIFLKIRAVGKAQTLPETGGLGNHDYLYPSSKSSLISKN